MVSWWGGRGGQGLGHINAVPPRPRRNRCACNFVAGHSASDRRLAASDVCYRGPHRESRRPAGSWPFKPVPAEARWHSGPYDETIDFREPYCSAPGRAAFFSLVFFAAQRRVTGSPRRGMSYGPWVQKPTPLKKPPRPPPSHGSHDPLTPIPSPSTAPSTPSPSDYAATPPPPATPAAACTVPAAAPQRPAIPPASGWRPA